MNCLAFIKSESMAIKKNYIFMFPEVTLLYHRLTFEIAIILCKYKSFHVCEGMFVEIFFIV